MGLHFFFFISICNQHLFHLSHSSQTSWHFMQQLLFNAVWPHFMIFIPSDFIFHATFYVSSYQRCPEKPDGQEVQSELKDHTSKTPIAFNQKVILHLVVVSLRDSFPNVIDKWRKESKFKEKTACLFAWKLVDWGGGGVLCDRYISRIAWVRWEAPGCEASILVSIA